ncbi:MAG TPA: GNAT family protein [Chryseosolibacter sp.]|nr:GNAT family protein [Chryseosolibacter sp.]
MDRLQIPETVVTDRLFLSRLRYEDAEEIFYTYASKPEATRFVSWATHTTVEDSRLFLGYAIAGWEEGTDYSFSIRLQHSAQMIGSIGLINDSGKIQFGYILSPTHWGQGYATEACMAVMNLLKSIPGIYRIHTFVDIENIASIRVLEKAGFVKEATLKNWFRFVNQHYAVKDCVMFYLPLEIK